MLYRNLQRKRFLVFQFLLIIAGSVAPLLLNAQTEKPGEAPSAKQPQIPDEKRTIKAKKVLGLLKANQALFDESSELVEFARREGPDQSLKYFTKEFGELGWKQTKNEQLDGVTNLRFENGKQYLRLVFWPFEFSNNSGTHNGIQGAICGTGIYWNDKALAGKPVQQKVKLAEKQFGPYTEIQRRRLTFMLSVERESKFWPAGKIPSKRLAQLPFYPGPTKQTHVPQSGIKVRVEGEPESGK